MSAPVRRIEDPRLLRGMGSFVDDIDPPGVLHAAILRSPYGHARIGALNVAAARAYPGVHAVYTAADLPHRVAAHLIQVLGNPESAFHNAPHVFEEQLFIERSCGSPIEARGVVAVYDPPQESLTVWDATQAPLTIKNGLANMLGLPEFKVEVIAPDVGGGFGTKIMLFFAEEVLVPWAAIQLRQPVKWTEERR